MCRVIGTVVGAAHHPMYDGQKLMIVQRVDEQGRDAGESFLAVDRVQAGPGDRVIVMSEGNGVRQVVDLGAQVPIRSIIIGIVDQVDAP